MFCLIRIQQKHAILKRTKHPHYQFKPTNLCTHITVEFKHAEWESLEVLLGFTSFFTKLVSATPLMALHQATFARRHVNTARAMTLPSAGQQDEMAESVAVWRPNANWNTNMIRCKSVLNILKHPGNNQEKIHRRCQYDLERYYHLHQQMFGHDNHRLQIVSKGSLLYNHHTGVRSAKITCLNPVMIFKFISLKLLKDRTEDNFRLHADFTSNYEKTASLLKRN